MRACDYPINNHIDTQQNTLNTNSSKFESTQFQIGYKQFQIESAHSSRLNENSSRLKDHSSRWRNLRWNIRNSGSRRGFQQSWALCKYWIFPKVSCTRDIFTRSSSLRLLDMACVSWDKNEHVCNVFASTNLMKWNEEISKRGRPRVWLPEERLALVSRNHWCQRHALTKFTFSKACVEQHYPFSQGTNWMYWAF